VILEIWWRDFRLRVREGLKVLKALNEISVLIFKNNWERDFIKNTNGLMVNEGERKFEIGNSKFSLESVNRF
jgi:hypothetical protein